MRNGVDWLVGRCTRRCGVISRHRECKPVLADDRGRPQGEEFTVTD
jgi:hypothetical protein